MPRALVFADCKRCRRPIVYRQTEVPAECDKYCAHCWNELSSPEIEQRQWRDWLAEP